MKNWLIVFGVLFVVFFPRSLYAQTPSGIIRSITSGNWNSPSVWDGGELPGSTDKVIIASGHTVTFNLGTTTVHEVEIASGSELRFDPFQSSTLQTTGNVVVYGKLSMKPAAASNIHTLRFVNVDESKFVGGGMDVLATDVGLWVMGGGRLDIAGTAKTSWLRLAGSANSGATTITLQSAPIGWQVGDEISIVPTEHPSVGTRSHTGFEVRTITGISGSAVTLSSDLSFNHPAATDPFSGIVYTAEVLNLTRNARIEGTGNGASSLVTNGRAHIFISSTQPQSIKHLAIRHMGPRKATGDTYLSNGQRVEIFDGVTGRYPLHFHMSGDGARGSVVEGVVVRQGGMHAFVPHASHGITFKDTIAYDIWDDAYWWDPPPGGTRPEDLEINSTHDVVYDRAVAAIVKADPSFRGTRLNGFTLTRGNNPIIKNSVAVGVQGNVDASGFNWPELGHAVWEFKEGNISHNNKIDGIFVWQNDSEGHEIRNYVGYHNGESGIDHGAYVNTYEYIDNHLFGNGAGVIERALVRGGDTRSDGYQLAFERVKSADPLEIREHTLTGINVPVLYKDCIFPRIIVNETIQGGLHDFVHCSTPTGVPLEPANFSLTLLQPRTRIRVQRPNGTAYQITNTGTTEIPAFYTFNTTPTVSLRSGDTNNDSFINLTDLSTLLANFGKPGDRTKGDFDTNNLVNLSDLSTLLANFGR